jgi:D-xylonolactonase
MKPELLANEHCGCGENPLWDDARGVLYWCDIPPGKIYQWKPDGSHRTVADLGRECGAFTLQENGDLLLFFSGAASILNPQTGALTPLQSGIVHDTGRFNDCIATPDGRIFAGTVDWEKQTRGGLFGLDLQLNAHEITRGTACSNGMAWTPDNRGLYWSDSTAKTVYLFDYDAHSGTLSNQRAWLETPDFTPDGLTIDRDGKFVDRLFQRPVRAPLRERWNDVAANRNARQKRDLVHFRRREFRRTVRHHSRRQTGSAE